MRSEWRTAKLVDVAAKQRWALNGGPFGSKLSRQHYSERGVPVIRGTNLSGASKFSFDDFVYVSEEKADELRANNARPGDLIFTQRGTIGQVGLIPFDSPIPRFVISQSQMKLTVDPGQVDALFLYYFFSAAETVQEIKNLAFAAGVPHINLDILRKFEAPIPPLALQRRIAGILSAYDELIENSQRRIRILEKMARALYREWFVHFRFPGHEKLPRVASPLSDVPRGWEVTTLRAVTTKIGSGATPRGGKEAYKSEGIHLIRSLNIYDYNFEFADLAFIDEQQAAELANVTVEENDILLNITGASVARCALVPSYLLPARVNQHVAIVRPDPAKASPFYVLDAINSDQRKQRLLALAQGGATREALTKDTVSNFEIALPPRSLMKRYDDIASGIHKQREVLLRQIQTLRGTRDLLLPRLLSGQVDLIEIETSGK
jgi:type I restriction enzyme, S subunit